MRQAPTQERELERLLKEREEERKRSSRADEELQDLRRTAAAATSATAQNAAAVADVEAVVVKLAAAEAELAQLRKDYTDAVTERAELEKAKTGLESWLAEAQQVLRDSKRDAHAGRASTGAQPAAVTDLGGDGLDDLVMLEQATTLNDLRKVRSRIDPSRRGNPRSPAPSPFGF